MQKAAQQSDYSVLDSGGQYVRSRAAFASFLRKALARHLEACYTAHVPMNPDKVRMKRLDQSIDGEFGICGCHE
jgi:hypothetical protein